MATNLVDFDFGIDFDPTKLEVERKITRDFLVFKPGITEYILFITAFEPDQTSFSEAVRRKNKDSPQDNDKPIDIAVIKNLQPPREEYNLMGHTALASQLNEAYPNKSYVGKMFQITQDKEKKGAGTRKYFSFRIVELRAPSAKPQTAVATEHRGAKK